jgi:RecJ-like exonuclease
MARRMASALGTNQMICEKCEGEGFVRGTDPTNPGALVILPCLECNGSGIAYCCDTGGSYVASYINPDYPERTCDYCGKLYRGPAVYCSLECATDDL